MARSLHLIAVGRQRDGPEAALFARYALRIQPPLILTEIAEARGQPGEVKRREAAALLAAVPGGAVVVALDSAGAAPDSLGLASMLRRWLELGRPICFVIGGAEGLDRTVIERAEHVLSLGKLTWPHLMVRAMLAEQLYRARSILAGHPYHRGTRCK